MTGTRLLGLLAATALVGACETTAEPIAETLASSTLRAADGASSGTATLVSIGGEVELRVAAENLSPGAHGFHLHAVGRCDAPSFASAGPHLNPHGKMHGRDNPQGSHLGDLPNLVATADGKSTLAVKISGRRAELEPQLFDADGTAIVIHEGPDDHRTDPAGSSGARIACGVLQRG